MDHNYKQDENFNILTIRYDKKGRYFLTGETKLGIAVGDTVNYTVNDKYDILEVDEITERRDSRSFPKGNNLHYECFCKVIPKPEAPKG